MSSRARSDAEHVSALYASIYRVVQRIPRGKVATYGQVAILAGIPGHARQVGYALNALPEGSRVPWHRVINERGTVSPRAESVYEEIQKRLLEEEGIEIGTNDRISLDRYRWRSRALSPPGRGDS